MDLRNAPIGLYRSRDPPKNFCLNVKLWRVTSGSIVPAIRHQSVPALQQHGAEFAREAIEMEDRGRDQSKVEEISISWQEKLFCEREIAFYDIPLNCISALDQKYSQEIASLLAANARKNSRIFTYVDADCHRVDTGGIFNELSNMMTDSANEEPNYLVEKMSQLNFMTSGRRNISGADQRANVVEEIPSKHVRDNHVITTPSRLMYIMADLSPSGRSSTREDEYVLCVIKIDANGQIILKPDLTKDMPYRIETFDQAKEVFEYTIKDVSQQISSVEKQQESKLLEELYDRHAEVMASQTGMELYPQLALDEVIYYVFGEIVCARNFEYDDLYVEFFVDLPEHWRSLNNQISWTTQSCSLNSNEMAYFSYPFELQLCHKTPEDGTDPFVTLPTLFFEVASFDSWQRYRKEGYGYTLLPNTAGCHVIEIATWRPYGSDVSQQMRRFFTGGAPELDDISYVKIPTESEGSHLSKFGFKTVSSGVLTLRLHTILQHRTQRTIKHGRSAGKRFKSTAGMIVAMQSLAGVLDTFHRAKRRMLAAKSTLPVIN